MESKCGNEINLDCQTAPNVGYLIQNFKYVSDSTFSGKIGKEKIIFEGKGLSKLGSVSDTK